MAAGLGFKTFTTGEVLTAGDVNGYLMQGVLVFATAAARNSAITSPQEGQFAFTKDTNGLWYYDGAAWVASGATGDIEGVTAGVGISGGGTSGTVTVTNDMATTITAAGDIVVGTGSGTYDNLPIGTTAQVLTADTTVSPYKVKWATPAVSASGLTVVKARTAFTGVANTGTTFDSVFTSTYKNYVVVIEHFTQVTAADDPQLQLLYSGTTQAAGYYGGVSGVNAGGTLSQVGNVSTSEFAFWDNGSGSAGTFLTLNFTNVGTSSENAAMLGHGMEYDGLKNFTFGMMNVTARTYTGFMLKSASSNISGFATVYGLAAS